MAVNDEPQGSPTPTVDPARIAERAVEVRQRVAAAGGDPDRVVLVGVTKALPVAVGRAAIEAGLVDLGESYAQELVAKAVDPELVEARQEGRLRWHFIGNLQRNKVKRLVGSVHLWHSVDREVLVDEIARRDPGARILIQVNTTGEATKAGCEPDHTPGLVDRARGGGLDVAGLMTVGPTDTAVDPRPAFASLRRLGEQVEVEELSMGMSGDFELAVAEGSTIIRVGTVLFGARPRPQGRNTATG